MLVIEGSDCLGKTTLAKAIVRKVSEMGIPVVYSWMTRPNEDKFDFFHAYKDMLNPCAVQDRFHLGGLAYHKDKISSWRLQIINAWIRSIGGLIVVLYAADEEWYEQRIRADERENILSWPIMCQGNTFFKKYARTGDVDYSFNILPELCYDEFNGKPMFISDADIDELINEWISRRRELGLGDI